MKKSVSFLVPVVFILLITIAIISVSCSKSGSGSKPVISIQSINSPIGPDGQLDVKLKFTNGGNLANGNLLAIRLRVNTIPTQDTLGGDTVLSPIPSFGNTATGQLEYNQPYQGYLHYSDHLNDTLVFKFAAISSSGLSSDTITSPQVVIINP